MARFLFVVPPLTGHVNPTVSVARALEARGHEVAWVAHPRAVRPLLPSGATLFELDDEVPEERWNKGTEEAKAARGLSAMKFLWEEFFVPLARAMIPTVDAVVDRYAPDVLVVDQQALAGAMIARRRDMKWATFATTSAGLTDPLADLPKVREWLDERIAEVAREAGLEPMKEPDKSPHCVIAFTTRALVGADQPFSDHIHFVGPAFRERREVERGRAPVDLPLAKDKKKVLVTLGTVNAEAGDRFYEIVLSAFSKRDDVQIVLVAPSRFADRSTANVVVRAWVPQLALLSDMDAVVCHAGHNTVCEALSHGLPLVVLPIKDDQPVVAQQVTNAGAGIRLKFGRVREADLAAAIDRVLVEASFRDAAARVAKSFREAGGAARAAEILEALT